MLRRLIVFASVATAKVVHSISIATQGWNLAHSAEPTDAISLKVALRQSNAEALEKLSLDVATPGHPSYGKHLSRRDLRAYTAPSPGAVDAVTAWAQKHGIDGSSIDVDHDWVTVHTTVAHADTLLDTRFAWYKQQGSNEPVLRSPSYSVPDTLAHHVDLVYPTTRFGELDSRRMQSLGGSRRTAGSAAVHQGVVEARADVNSSCWTVTTAQCLTQLYDVSIDAVPGANSNRAAIATFNTKSNSTDLDHFLNEAYPDMTSQEFDSVLVNNTLSTNVTVHANAVAQYFVLVSGSVPVVEYSVGGQGVNASNAESSDALPLVEYLNYMLNKESNLPQTLIIPHSEREDLIPREYAIKVCNKFMELGLRGVSILASSGDTGGGDECVRTSDNKPFFEARFPASCPYVTAVGSTWYTKVLANPAEQISTFSSGGFSSIFTRPKWQNTVVSHYLPSVIGFKDYFNKGNRAFPDVSAVGQDYVIIDNGNVNIVSGSMMAVATFGGMVARLNAERRSQKKPALGFLNPWLYNATTASSFHDISGSKSWGCTNINGSWPAVTGWDAVTGLGSPHYLKLLSAMPNTTVHHQ